MNKKKILYCEGNSDGTIGGSYFSLLYLIEGLNQQEFSPEIIFYQEHTLLSRFRSIGVPVHQFTRPRPFHLPLLNRMRSSRYSRLLSTPLLWLQKAVNLVRGLLIPALAHARFLRANRFDLVHLNNSVIRNQPWMLACRLAGVPCVTHERGISKHYPWISRMLAKRLQAVICISYAVRDNLICGGIDPQNLVVIRNGLDPSRMRVERAPAEVREELAIEPDRPVIGIIGNIKEWKGQDTVARAVAIIKQRVPNLVCLLVGDTAASDHYFELRLRSLVDELGVRDNIVFTGYRRNVADYMNLMDVVVHASVEPEPFGRVLIEAMALGKPVVGAGAGAVPEILDEGRAGLTFTPGNASELAQAVLSLLDNHAYSATLALNGHRRMSEEFHIHRNIESTVGLYRSILVNPLPVRGDKASA